MMNITASNDTPPPKKARYAPGSRKGKGGRPRKTAEQKRARKTATQWERRERERQPFIRNGRRRRTPKNPQNTLGAMIRRNQRTLFKGLTWRRKNGCLFTAPRLTRVEAIKWAVVLAVLDQETHDLMNDWKGERGRLLHNGDSFEKKPAASVRPKGAGPDAYDRDDEDARFERNPLDGITALNWKIDGGDGEW